MKTLTAILLIAIAAGTAAASDIDLVKFAEDLRTYRAEVERLHNIWETWRFNIRRAADTEEIFTNEEVPHIEINSSERKYHNCV